MILTTESSTQFKTPTITLAQVASRAPSALALGASPSRSSRYTYVPTHDVVSALQGAGWEPVEARHAAVRRPERQGFQKHLIRLRLARQIQHLDEYCVELLLVNSHDGSSSYELHASLFRRICANGLVISDSTFETVWFPHRGSSTRKVVDGSLALVEAVPSIAGRVGAFKARNLNILERARFAEKALAVRYPNNPPVRAETLLHTRRYQDAGVSLWATLNVVQENLVRGGISDHQRTRGGNLRTVRAIRGIDSSVNVNKGLWDLAVQTLAE